MKRVILMALTTLAATWLVAQETAESKKQEQVKLPVPTDQLDKTLRDYASGRKDLHGLHGDRQSPLRKQLIAYYKSTTNQITVEQKFVIAVCMGREGDFKAAANLAEDYVSIRTNDARGWSMLGTASAMCEKTTRAVEAYQHAVALGDEMCLTPLASDALALNRLDIVRDNIPKLIKWRDSDEPPLSVKLDIIGVLVIYAYKANSEETFLKALEGTKVEDILSRKDVTAVIGKVCEQFDSPKSQAICQRIAEAKHRKSSEKEKQ